MLLALLPGIGLGNRSSGYVRSDPAVIELSLLVVLLQKRELVTWRGQGRLGSSLRGVDWQALSSDVT